jgi:hypothetical protein
MTTVPQNQRYEPPGNAQTDYTDVRRLCFIVGDSHRLSRISWAVALHKKQSQNEIFALG